MESIQVKQNFRTIKKTVPIDTIVPNPWNPNVQSKEMFEKGKQSLETLGMLGSILVREVGGYYQILDGEHRWKYGKELGYTEMTIESIGEIPDKEAQMLTILINNIHGKDDIERRAKIFEALDQEQLQLLPFSKDEIDNEKALFKFDFSQYDKHETVEEIKKDTLIQIIVPNEVKELWLRTVKLASDEGMDEVQVIVHMMEHFIALRKGASEGQRTQIL